MTALPCPAWCVDHYDGTDGYRNHAGPPDTVTGEDVSTGAPVELGMWLERRDNQDDGTTATVGVLEVRPINDDLELTPPRLRELARKLNHMADLADETDHLV
jgi:hypothetical protein